MMRMISAEFFARSPVLVFPILALGLFMIVFVVISLRAVLTSKTQLDAASRLPFDTDTNERSTQDRGHE